MYTEEEPGSGVAFEFDEAKSRANKLKHGIDFVEAQKLWQDEDLVVVRSRDIDEPRFIVVAKTDDRYWAAVITYRGAAVRIISVRRARAREVRFYEGE